MSGTSVLRASRRQPLAVGGLVVLALLFPTACDDHIIGRGAPIRTSCRREPALSWENFGDGLIGRHCRPCHGEEVREGQRGDAPLGVDFDTYEDVLEWANAIHQQAVEAQSMPPAGGMLPVEREQLDEWFRCDVFPASGDFVPEEGS